VVYNLTSLQDFFKTWQSEYINLLENCGLIGKFTPDCKKLLVYCFMKNMNEILGDSHIVFYHNHILSPDLEIFNYVDYDAFNTFFDKLSRKIKKLTGKIVFIKNMDRIPKKVEYFHNLDGEIQDEILLIQNFEPDPRKIRDYLSGLKLKDIFTDMTWKLI
jgi:hypothetical protein